MTGEAHRETNEVAAPDAARRFARCLVMAGAGSRLGVHLGAYAALCEAGLEPDVVLGTCGGGLVAALVHAEPDPARALDWLAGPAMHGFWRDVRVRPGARLARVAARQAARVLDPRPAPRVPDLDDDAIFEAPAALPEMPARAGIGERPEAGLVAARLLFDPGQHGTPRAGRPLFEPVVFGTPRVRALLAGEAVAVAHGAHAGSAIAPAWRAIDAEAAGWATAARLSMTDMTYLAPSEALGARWLGGAVDLLPLELATRLADDVWFDRKDPMPRLTFGAAWRAVLGLDARGRQREVDRSTGVMRIDHRGLSRTLRAGLVDRRLRWPAAAGARWLQLEVPEAPDDYRRLVEDQVDEGRRRAQQALRREAMDR